MTPYITVYQSNNRFYVDAIRVGIGSSQIYSGESVPIFESNQHIPALEKGSILEGDVQRFFNLADGYVAPDLSRDNVLVDIRYSMLPTSITPMWGIDLNVASASQHVKFENYRDRPDKARELFVAMLLGRDLPD